MREVMNGLVDPLAVAGRADVAVDICDPYPIPVICELLGAPKEDWRLFSRLAEDVLLIFSGNLLEIFPRVVAAQEELEEYTKGLIAARRSTPAEDLITDLIAAEEAGDRLDTDELVMMVEAVIVGGTDTTRNQLGLAMALGVVDKGVVPVTVYEVDPDMLEIPVGFFPGNPQ
jgi:cytochrome P450